MGQLVETLALALRSGKRIKIELDCMGDIWHITTIGSKAPTWLESWNIGFSGGDKEVTEVHTTYV